MKKTINTKTAIELYNAIEESIQTDFDLPVQFAWDMETNSETLKHIVEKFERNRAKILTPLREKDAFEDIDNNQIKIKAPYVKEFEQAMKKINEYLTVENEIEIKTVKKEDIPSSISVKDLRAVKFMIADAE